MMYPTQGIPYQFCILPKVYPINALSYPRYTLSMLYPTQGIPYQCCILPKVYPHYPVTPPCLSPWQPYLHWSISCGVHSTHRAGTHNRNLLQFLSSSLSPPSLPHPLYPHTSYILLLNLHFLQFLITLYRIYIAERLYWGWGRRTQSCSRRQWTNW